MLDIIGDCRSTRPTISISRFGFFSNDDWCNFRVGRRFKRELFAFVATSIGVGDVFVVVKVIGVVDHVLALLGHVGAAVCALTTLDENDARQDGHNKDRKEDEDEGNDDSDNDQGQRKGNRGKEEVEDCAAAAAFAVPIRMGTVLEGRLPKEIGQHGKDWSGDVAKGQLAAFSQITKEVHVGDEDALPVAVFLLGNVVHD